MATGSPTFRLRSGSDNLVPGGWGVQPAEPLLAIGPVKLPAKSTLDYVHSLTQTTLLLVGLVAFAVVYRGRPRRAVRKLVDRV